MLFGCWVEVCFLFFVVLEYSLYLIFTEFQDFGSCSNKSILYQCIQTDGCLYNMCKYVLFSGTEFQLWLLKAGYFAHIPPLIQMLMWPLESSLLVIARGSE